MNFWENMKKIRTVVAGLGRIGWVYHLPQLRKHPGFDLTAAADPVAERRDEVERQYPGVKSYADFEEMLVREQPELAVIASPTIFHAEQILAAFRHGADVFSEKPLAVDLTETETVLRAMDACGRKLMVYQPRRLDHDCRQAREIIGSGVLGRLHLIRRNIRNYARRNDWQALKRYAGGMLNNYGVHYLDQLCYTAGFDFACEYCALRRVNSVGDAEDCLRVILRNPDGVTGEVEISQSCAFPTNEWLLEGNLGTAMYSSLTKSWRIRYVRPDQLQATSMQNTLAAVDRRYPHDRVEWNEEFDFTAPPEPDFYDNLYDYLAGTAPALVKTEETRAIMALLARARELDGERHVCGR